MSETKWITVNGAHIPLDHGVLNMPLSKRGDIDAQLDKYKAEQSRKEKLSRSEQSAKMASDKKLAKSLLSTYQEAIIERLGHKYGHNELRNTLQDLAKWEPSKLISIVEKHKKETGT